MTKPQILGLFAHTARLTTPFAALAVMLAACSGDGADGGGAGLPGCPSSPSVCASAGLEADDAPDSLTMVGTVAEVLSPGGASPCARQTVLVIEAGTGMEVRLQLESDSALPAIAVGDKLDIARDVVIGDSEGNPGSSLLLVTRAGELIAYDADAEHDLPSLPDGITLMDGEALCYGRGDFCDYQEYALDVSSGGVTVTMSAGETATVGSHRVVLRNNRGLIDTGGCDAGSFHRRLVVWPAP